jgi:uridine kinase
MIADVLALKAGKTVQRPVYDYSIHNRAKETVTVYPKRILMLEGILILESEELRNLMDLKIFVDTDADVRILRRILRDVKERGRSLDSVINQYLTTVKPMHEAFVEPSKRNADIIVPNGGENTTAIEMLAHHIRSLIEKANML